MFANVFKFDINQPRDEAGRFSKANTRGGTQAQMTGNGSSAPDALANHYAKYDDPNVTPKTIMSKFSEAERGEVAALIVKAKSDPVSKAMFTNDKGEYTPERLKLHQQIMSDILNDAAVKAATPGKGEKPTFVVLGGRGGSGKSSFTNGKVNEFDGSKFLVLDSDAIKERLKPPYKGWNAFNVHEESSDIFDQITQVAKGLKLNLVHDATLKSNSIEKTVEEFKKDGYDIEGHYMFVPRQVSADRAVKRYLSKGPDKRGRLVPVDVILQNTENEKNFDNLKKHFKKWSAYDNQGAAPTLINRSK